MSNTRDTLAINLRALLNHAVMTEKELEIKSGVSQKAINNILNKVNSPRVETVEMIAQAFGFSGWELLTNTAKENATEQATIQKLTGLLQVALTFIRYEARLYDERQCQDDSKHMHAFCDKAIRSMKAMNLQTPF